MSTKYAVLGGGNAGFAFAGHLGLKDLNVNIYEDIKFEKGLEYIKSQGGIKVNGFLEGFAKLNKITSNMEEAVSDVDVIIIAVPEFAQRAMFEEYIKYAKDGQIIAFFPGNYATFKFKNLIEESEKELILAEAASIPYGARKREPGTVSIIGWKKRLNIAAYPADKTEFIVNKFNEVNNIFVPSPNVLAASMANSNYVLHCVSTALNAGWVETTKGDFSIYADGMSPSVCNVMEAVDKERLSVAKAYGFDIKSVVEFFGLSYQVYGQSIYECVHNSDQHTCSGAPGSLQDRYITEDAPAGLTATIAFGKKAGVATPISEAVLTICSALNQTDYYEVGLNLKNLSIENMNVGEINTYIGGN